MATSKKDASPRLRKPQTRLQKIPQVNPHQEPAKRVQVGFLFQAPGENRKRRLEGGFPKSSKPARRRAWSHNASPSKGHNHRLMPVPTGKRGGKGRGGAGGIWDVISNR